ncbi:flagellar basal body P-ring protein FlgI, partial [Campylobacter jejuni]|uniref:flagellar basal body P-ring protein FlgI n=1 Tax=Campylobacter jejuni TaxID=197 RepID=UPI003752C3AF
AIVNGGANEKREIPQKCSQKHYLTVSLKLADFKTANDKERVLNTVFGEEVAKAIDSRTLKLKKPEDLSNVDFMARVLEQDIAYKPQSKVIIDERTGTVIARVDVEVEPVLITHKDITIKIDPNNNAVANQNEIDMKDGGFVD